MTSKAYQQYASEQDRQWREWEQARDRWAKQRGDTEYRALVRNFVTRARTMRDVTFASKPNVDGYYHVIRIQNGVITGDWYDSNRYQLQGFPQNTRVGERVSYDQLRREGYRPVGMPHRNDVDDMNYWYEFERANPRPR